MGEGKKSDLNWDSIRAELDSMDWEDREDGFGEQERRVYIGSVFGIMPSGKYYMPWACSNVTEEEANADEEYRELIEEEASARGLWLDSGEGDPCDIFVGETRDKPEEDEEEGSDEE